jgi:ADP-ribose pyrophosphatase YjhB (NUDIX family)
MDAAVDDDTHVWRADEVFARKVPVDGRPNIAGLSETDAQVLDQIETQGWHAVSWNGGYTLIHWAASQGKGDLCQYLLSLHADPDERDGSLKTPMEYAKDAGHKDVCQVLQRPANRPASKNAVLREKSSVREFSTLDTTAALEDYHFETRVTNERAKKKSHYWKWLTAAECAALDVEISAQGNVLAGYSELEVDSSRFGVLKMMDAHGATGGEDIDEDIMNVLLRNLAAQCAHFRYSGDDNSVVLVNDVSRVYLADSNRLLMQRGRQSPQEQTKFVDIEKLPSVNAQEAVRLFWNDVLKMPPDAATYFEGETVFEDAEPFGSIRQILRVHEVHINIVRTDAPELKGIMLPSLHEALGLPACRSFTVNDKLELTWLTAGECEDLDRDTYDALNCGGKVDFAAVTGGRTLACFEEFLGREGISFESWAGQGGARTVKDLLNEVHDGTIDLVRDGKNRLQRRIGLVVLHIRNVVDSRYLVEVGAGNACEDVQWNTYMPAGRIERGELPREAARRILREYLLLADDDIEILRSTHDEETRAEKHAADPYPGLPSMRKLSFFDVYVHNKAVMEKLPSHRSRPRCAAQRRRACSIPAHPPSNRGCSSAPLQRYTRPKNEKEVVQIGIPL